MRRHAQPVATFDVNACPVADATLSRLYRAGPEEVRAIAMELPELQRMQLAAFCYGRSHLRAVGREVALVCNTDKVVSIAGWDLTGVLAPPEHVERTRSFRPQVTLATRKDMEGYLPSHVVHLSDSEDHL